MRDEAEVILIAFEKYWDDFDRKELVARAFNAGLVAGWNLRNANDSETFESYRRRMRAEMTGGKRHNNGLSGGEPKAKPSRLNP